jgi:hypothetical protein
LGCFFSSFALPIFCSLFDGIAIGADVTIGTPAQLTRLAGLTSAAVAGPVVP